MTLPPPPPHPQPDPVEGGRRMQPRGGGTGWSPEGEEGAECSIEKLTEDRRGRPALSLTLGNTGVTYKPSRQETAVSVVHWNSMTRRLL